MTVEPIAPDVGEKESTVGGGKNINPLSLLVPFADFTSTSPEAPLPTIAVIWVASTIFIELASTPPKVTEVTLDKFEPFIVIIAPVFPEAGEKETISGGGR